MWEIIYLVTFIIKMNWSNPLISALFPAIALGLINYFYNRRKGLTNIGSFILSVIVFYAIFYTLFKTIFRPN